MLGAYFVRNSIKFLEEEKHHAKKIHPPLIISYLCLLPLLAFAHSSDFAVYGGFPQGLWHPVLGLDHLLAMVSVGIVSAQMGGRAIWSIPTAFVIAMIFGGIVGMNISPEVWEGTDIYGVIEKGIAVSVVLLGSAITLNRHLPVAITMAYVALFGAFHGAAHGVEIPELAIGWAYISGFVMGTSALHIVGVAIGGISTSPRLANGNGATLLRYAGAAIAGMGVHILLGHFGL